MQTTAYARIRAAAVAAGIGLIYLTSLHSYLLFHALSELFSIIVAAAIFVIAWNGRAYLRDGFLFCTGLGYLFVGGLDLLHTLSYQGMAIFPGEHFSANQLWVAARLLEAMVLLLAFRCTAMLTVRQTAAALLTFAAYTTIVILSIFVWQVFPVCYVPGSGQTMFKIVSGYAGIALFALTLALLRRQRQRFSPAVYRLLFWAILCTIVQEFCFTLYVSNFGLSNQAGHLLKLLSFFLVYRALVETGIREPYAMVFRELDLSRRLLENNAQQLQEQNERLLALDRQKNYYLSVISHDIRSPLTFIRGGVELLEPAPGAPAENREVFRIIHDGINRIERLVSDIIFAAKFEQESATPAGAWHDPGELIEAQLPAFRLAAQPRQQAVQWSRPAGAVPAVCCDRDLIARVLDNLVTNALKFTPDGGTVTLAVAATERGVRFTVHDTGPGIPAEQQQRIFEKFQQADRDAARRGVGLGLAICRDIVLRHRGQIGVESGGGTTFWFTLPTGGESAPA